MLLVVVVTVRAAALVRAVAVMSAA